jgi:amidase
MAVLVVLALVILSTGTALAKPEGNIVYVSRELKQYAIGSEADPVVTVQPGDILVIETEDCFDNQIQTPADTIGEIDFERVNPATGPIYVEGAEPGDTLVVEILKIDLGHQGVMVTVPGLGVLADEVESSTRILPIEGNKVIWDENFSFAIKPMIGVIGVAPKGEPIACGAPGDHGGNMDCNEIGEGCTVNLPVNVEGAYLHMGDCHARQGDGEVCGTGVEIRTVVTCRVNLIKNTGLERPVLERDNRIMFMGSHEDLFTACQIALRDMAHYLMKVKNLTLEEALILSSAIVDMKIAQLVDPLLTVRAELDLAILH